MTTAVPTRTGSRRNPILSMIAIESKLVLRRRTTVLSVLAGPVVLIAYAILLAPDDPAAWAALAGLGGVVGLLISAYNPATSTLTLRRETMVLSRLRTTELSGWQIVASALTPLIGLGIAQSLLVFGVYVGLGSPLPVRPELIVVGLLLGGLLTAAAAAVTSSLSSSAEGVQFAVLPLFLLAAVGANMLAGPFSDQVRALMLLIPLTPVADLVARGWVGPGAPELVSLPVGLSPVLVDVLMLLIWTAVFGLLAKDRWRWTPRG